MSIYEIILISIGLAMDATTAAICLGMTTYKINNKKIILIGACFGFFQMIMPLIGFFVGNIFTEFIKDISHIIAFILLEFVGINMLESNSKEVILANKNFNYSELILLGIATSIDALAIGITFAFLKTNIIVSSTVIGVITCILSIIGAKIGNCINKKIKETHKEKMQKAGGIILILIGIKILIKHSI